jgi:hypothetical protein
MRKSEKYFMLDFIKFRPQQFVGASIGSICYVLSWMIRVMTIQYYANFALGYLMAEQRLARRFARISNSKAKAGRFFDARLSRSNNY